MACTHSQNVLARLCTSSQTDDNHQEVIEIVLNSNTDEQNDEGLIITEQIDGSFNVVTNMQDSNGGKLASEVPLKGVMENVEKVVPDGMTQDNNVGELALEEHMKGVSGKVVPDTGGVTQSNNG